MDLRNVPPLSLGFGNPTVELAMLLGVQEVLGFEDLEFSIFLTDSEDGERAIVELVAINCVTHT